MRAVALTLVCLALPGMAQEVATPPSGQALELHEVLYEVQPYSEELWVILRVLAPAIGNGGIDPETAQEDMDWSCLEWAQSAAEAAPEPPTQIVVQMMERAVPRGQTDPDTVQFFAGYLLQDGSCIWEGF